MSEMDGKSGGPPPTYQDLFRQAHTLLTDIQDLRISVLPQPRLVMLHERAAELRNALRLGAKAVYRKKKYAEAKNNLNLAEAAGKALSSLAGFFPVLRTLNGKVSQDIILAEQVLRHGRFYSDLTAYKKELRALLGSLKDDATGQAELRLVEISTAVERLKETKDALNAKLNPKLESYYKIFDSIFSALEKYDHLAPANAEITIALRAPAYQAVAASRIFDRDFYLAQLPDPAAAPDAIKHYLTNNPGGQYFSNKFFHDRYYLAMYPEVRRLRYNALEHFARYGDALRYNPYPEFNTRFYLENNDDVLDAGVSPFMHFLFHGLKEERPPSGKAAAFFNARYLDESVGHAIKIVFAGEPEKPEDKKAWGMLRKLCEANAKTEVKCIDSLTFADARNDADGYVVCGESLRHAPGSFLRALEKSGAALVYFGSDPQGDLAELLRSGILPLPKICAFTNNYERFIRWQESETSLKLHYYPFDDATVAVSVASALLKMIRPGGEFAARKFVQAPTDAPAISVVSIIYKKSKEMCAFLESLNRQDIARDYEVILVNDATPDNAVHVVEAWLEEKRAAGLLNRFMRVSILNNESNLGNCLSRNKGIEASNAEIVLVADGDMVFGCSCLAEHCWAYRFSDCDAVIGFFHFNMDYDFIFTWAAACEVNPGIVRKKVTSDSAYLAMCYPMDGIYNFVTRNTSFKKSILHGNYFDPDFSYTTNPDSGYGEEDHELSARLYFEGRRVRFVENAFGIHIRHQDNSYSADKALSNLRNWNRLIAKHPEMMLVDRHYYQWRTTDFLDKTRSRSGAKEFIEANSRYNDKNRVNIVIKKLKPLKILTYRWHAAHQYELFKLRHNFTLVTGSGTAICDQWDYGQRPLPGNVRFAPLHSINAKEYDFAILPFDENVLHPELCNGALSLDWGKTFLTMLALTRGMPRVALCHGMPGRYGDFLKDGDPVPDNIGRVIESEREAFRELLKDTHVVHNSHQAQSEWQFHKSSVIWHGFSPYELPPGSHEKACLTLPKNVFAERPQYWGKASMEQVEKLLKDVCLVEYAAPPPPHSGYEKDTQEWAVAGFQNYTRYLGRSAIYLTPAMRNAMPRSRAEAMMTGSIPVSMRNCDVDMFIKNGLNGFVANSAEEMKEHIVWLMKNDTARLQISKNARNASLDIFNIDRNLSLWSELIDCL